jgi:hypothetical protein
MNIIVMIAAMILSILFSAAISLVNARPAKAVK